MIQPANLKAFLAMIATSEIGEQMLLMSDEGYDVVVGSTPQKLHLFSPYTDHPRILVDLGHGLKSTAAGRYQILEYIYDHYKVSLNLPDFSPQSQDAIAVQLIKERHGLQALEKGDFTKAVNLCSSCWASLPNSPYGQHTNHLDDLRMAYMQAGGTFAESLA